MKILEVSKEGYKIQGNTMQGKTEWKCENTAKNRYGNCLTQKKGHVHC